MNAPKNKADKTAAPPPASREIAAMQRWLERAVIGLNLCPFAKAVHSKGQIRWVLCKARTPQSLLKALVDELLLLAQTPAQAIDTTVLVHPQVLQDFDAFNQFQDVVEAVLHELQLDGQLQVASFHPQFRFAGTRSTDLGNNSNRAPYPTLHLLREDSISRAVAAFPQAELIFERNVATLRKLGRTGFKRLLADD